MPSGEEEAVRSRGRQQSGTADAHSAALASPTRPAHLARARLVSAISLTTVAIVFTSFIRGGFPIGNVWLVLAFLAFQAANCAVAARLQPSDSQFVQQFDEAVFVAGVLLLPPAGV